LGRNWTKKKKKKGTKALARGWGSDRAGPDGARGAAEGGHKERGRPKQDRRTYINRASRPTKLKDKSRPSRVGADRTRRGGRRVEKKETGVAPDCSEEGKVDLKGKWSIEEKGVQGKLNQACKTITIAETSTRHPKKKILANSRGQATERSDGRIPQTAVPNFEGEVVLRRLWLGGGGWGGNVSEKSSI